MVAVEVIVVVEEVVCAAARRGRRRRVEIVGSFISIDVGPFVYQLL